MKHEFKVRRGLVVTIVALVLVTGMAMVTPAQTQDPQNAEGVPQERRQANQGPLPDLAQLNLTPEQIQRIRIINAELKDQRQAAGIRLRQAHRALAEAMESPNQNETLIDQHSREVADAQAATIRLRALSEFRILQVLSPEQRMKLREMRAARQLERRLEQQQGAENNRQPRPVRRPNAFQRGRGGLRGINANRLPPPSTPQRSKP